MTVQEFLDKNPGKQEVVNMLCHMANHVVFAPPWTSIGWKELSEYAELAEDDFWEDADALTPLDYMNGQTAWKYKTNEGQFTDNNKFDKLAEQSKLIHQEMQLALKITKKNY